MADIAAPKPFYRSRLFWLGVPGLVFLLYLWFGFTREKVSLTWDTPTSQWFAGWGDGALVVGRDYYGGQYSDSDLGVSFQRRFLEPEEKTRLFFLPPALVEETTGTRALWVSNWFAVLTYLAAWVGLLAWHHRRKVRPMKDLRSPATMTHPWHRSRLFWLGVPGLLFLVWAWFVPDSGWMLRWTTRLSWTHFSYEPGAVEIVRMTGPAYGVTAGDVSLEQSTRSIDPKDRRYFRWNLAWVATNDPPVRFFSLTLPFWFLVPLYVAGWLASVACWQRRKARLMRPL